MFFPFLEENIDLLCGQVKKSPVCRPERFNFLRFGSFLYAFQVEYYKETLFMLRKKVRVVSFFNILGRENVHLVRQSNYFFFNFYVEIAYREKTHTFLFTLLI